MIQTITPFLTGIAALAAVLAIVVLGGRAVRLAGWRPGVGPARRLRLVEAIAVDQRRRLHLLSCDGREVLVMTGGPADVTLGWLPDGQSVLPGAGR